jgi:hypothetical protein
MLSLNGSVGSSKCYGIMVNLHEGNISLVIDGKMQLPAFGKNAICFSKLEQDRQR